MAELQMRFFGDVDVAIDGSPLAEIKSKKALALLCYLAVTSTVHDRLALATLLWGDTPEANARMNLRKVVATLRHSMSSYLVITNDTMALDRNSRHSLDVQSLEQAGALVRTGKPIEDATLTRLQEAVDLYRGDFLAGFYVRNAPLFEEWALAQQARLRESALALMDRLAGGYVAQGHLDEAIKVTRRLLQLEPWREQAHRQLMLYLAQSGRRGEALAQFESCRQILVQEFDAEPSPATVSLFEAIRDKTFESLAGRQEKPAWTFPQKIEPEDRSQPPPSPYRGLFAFREEDAPFFFGREAITERLLALAHRQPLVAIVGPSGCGKSSLAAAGLVAGLQAEEGWHYVALRPGSQPFRALAAALIPLLEPHLSETGRLVEASKMAAAMQEGVLSLGSVVDRIIQLNEPAGRLLVLVDQFEELYTLCPDESVRRRFLGELLDAVQEQRLRPGPVACMSLALRADFMEQALAHRPFADALQESTLILGPMSREELSRAIERPAEIQGVIFEAGLADRILDDVGAKSGSLPLLEFALSQLWEEQDGWLLTHSAYDAIGRVQGALARYADVVYAELSDTEKVGARRVFVQMVRPGGRSEDTRRVALRQEISDRDWLLVQRLADARLLVTARDPSGRETAELVHEALILVWRRFQDWLEEDRAFRLWQERLRAAWRAWQNSEKDEDALLRGRLLAEAEGWSAEQGDRLSPAEVAFVKESQALRQREQTGREESRLARERNRRRIIISLAVLLVIAIGALIFALGQSRRAEAQARLAFARELTAAAVSNLGSDPELSIHLALKAVRVTHEADGIILAEAEQTLHRAVQAMRVLYVIPQGGGLAFNHDGSLLATGGADGAVIVVNAYTGETIERFKHHPEAVTGLAFSPDDFLLAGVSDRRQVVVWDLASRQIVLELPAHGGSGPVLGSSAVAFSPNGQYLLLAGPAADTEIWDVATGRLRLYIKESAAPDAAFSPDGKRLALTTAIWDIPVSLVEREHLAGENNSDPLVLTWDDRLFDFADAIVGIQDPSSNVSAYQDSGSVAFSPDGERLLTTVISNLAVLLDANSGDPLQTLSEHGGIIHSALFSPDGKRVATASADGTSRIWATETGEVLLSLEGHQDEVVSVDFHPDGNYLATGSLDGKARVWDISAGVRGEWLSQFEHDGDILVAFNPQHDYMTTAGEDGTFITTDLLTGDTINKGALLNGGIAGLSYSYDGTRLAFGYAGGYITIVEAATGKLMRTIETGGSVRSLAFSPDGSLMAEGDADGALTLWDINTGQVVAKWMVHNNFVNGLVFSPDGDRLASASADGQGLIMDTGYLLAQQSGGGGSRLPPEAILASLTGHSDLIVSLKPSPDGRLLVTASWDGTAIVWDGISGKSLLTLRGHNGQVIDAAFSPDGQRIATAGSDGKLILWDASSGERLFVLASLETPLRSLAFSRDGMFLAATGTDGAVRVYVPQVEELMDLAEERLTRALTGEECRRYLHVDSCSN